MRLDKGDPHLLRQARQVLEAGCELGEDGVLSWVQLGVQRRLPGCLQLADKLIQVVRPGRRPPQHARAHEEDLGHVARLAAEGEGVRCCGCAVCQLLVGQLLCRAGVGPSAA